MCVAGSTVIMKTNGFDSFWLVIICNLSAMEVDTMVDTIWLQISTHCNMYRREQDPRLTPLSQWR